MFSNFRQRVYAGKTAALLGPLPPQSISGSTAVNGQIIDRLGAQSAKFILERAIVSGAPTAAAFAVIIQSGSTPTLTDATTFATLETALSVLTAGLTEYLINLEGAFRYIRIVVTPTYTGGTSPANVVAGELLLGDADYDPKTPGETVYGTAV